ncbi:MAG TPA: hypothetical protein VFO01_19395 [Trebonia sp.]|nr:hypothetical protein [Trebonia sp.]
MSATVQAAAAAFDDDRSVPSALAALHATVWDGNYALSTGDHENVVTCRAQARAMLAVLGLDPLTPAWQTGDSRGRLRAAARARGGYARRTPSGMPGRTPGSRSRTRRKAPDGNWRDELAEQAMSGQKR